VSSLTVSVFEALICVSPANDKTDVHGRNLLVVVFGASLLMWCNGHVGCSLFPSEGSSEAMLGQLRRGYENNKVESTEENVKGELG
jgi:hypothetical protein